ncbi:mismatch-specific DNA-glycosylase [Rhodovulum sulfidophilum]|uniref:mismatch-specific DNA-glycosylase n=1 Tax=Rhodovulum sulfidophilum TaxID=35806 RepID=UPI0005A9A6CE|nr:mismatch-specific DNA-glycosylase [Rhodovulum sulfidophilum]MBL3550921.1 mismatch-specific DNA-glycosylase [Rhodovulum sulfidophilum]MBL3575643.1 mismatch-specific DNA-glycosylase [Rhodovulum sulfidophilum]MBL3585085.1 mismatch-specific DNA-glycosylase [Rhodovulum sulfidophilum]MCE8432522.1 mismatch-specific DNA-glycosylase [Rhodovulum sulfidophilum]MCF4117690.1 mismatch-specific DNA-glycosylase [Rhodovulum sulfidophilum]
MGSEDILPDYVAPDLRSVFCGMAAGPRSAELGLYYAGHGNRFWPVLHRAGLVPEPLAVGDEARLLAQGIGLTDLAKGAWGVDAAVPAAAHDPDRLARFVETWRPRSLAFNGKRAAQIFLGRKRVDYGAQAFRGLPVWVLPSTSGAAARYWDETVWRAFGAALRRGG